MSTAAAIAKNTVFISFGEMGTRILSFLLVVAIARYLGDIGLGAFAFAFAFTDLLLNFVDLGIPMYLTREIAKNKQSASAYLSNVLGLRLSIFPFMLLTGVAAAFIIHASTAETRLVIILATVGTALSFLTDPFRMAFLANERGSYYSALIIFERLMFTAAGLVLLLKGYGLVPVLVTFVISQFVSLLLTSYVVRKKFASFSLKFDKRFILSIIRDSLPFGIANFLRMIYQRLDTLLISAFAGFAATGWYGAAYRITESMRFIPLVVLNAVFPAMSRLHMQSKEHVKLLYEKTFYYMLIAAVPMAVGLNIVAGRAIPFFYGSQFTPSVIALQLLIVAEALLFIHYIMGFLLGAVGKQHLFTIVTACYVAANAVLNLILIPRYSYIGAGAAAVITQAIAVITLYYFCTKNGYGLNLPKLIFKPAFAAAVMAAALVALKNVHLLAAMPAAAAVYIATLFIIKGVGKEEVDIIKKIIAGKVN